MQQYCSLVLDTSKNKVHLPNQIKMKNNKMLSFSCVKILIIFNFAHAVIGKDQLDVPISTPENQISTTIPENYKVFPDIGAFKIYLDLKSWNEARKSCIDDGAHLAVIKSDAEEKFILEMVEESKVSFSMWLGIHDIFEESDWVTIDDVPLSSTGWAKWRPGEPNNLYGNQNCGALYITGGLDDEYCTSQRPFLCKIQL